MKSKFSKINFTLGLVDINGSVATLNPETRAWTVIYVGEFSIKEGLWCGMKVNDVYKN
jgi:hypothetical protein